jgi:hypothetical protein
MRHHISILAACVGAVVFAAGCGKTESPPMPTAAPPAQSTQQASPTTAVPTPPLPAPDAPNVPRAADPAPGDAGSHSSPAFKAGGKADSPK